MTRPSAALILAAIMAAACTPTPAPQAPANFTVGELTESDGDIEGCSTMLSRVGGARGNIFIEDAVDTGAKGFIRINGNLIRVDLVRVSGEQRAFADAAHRVEVVETLTTGEAHEESDSVEQSGSVVVTFGGVTQTIAVEGGTAC
jgi:hypothetical protein